MITFSKFGRHGRLGNQLFQWASLIGMSSRYNQVLRLPIWEHQHLFEGFPENIPPTVKIPIEEKKYHHEWHQWDKHIKNNKGGLHDVLGWLQSEKYWEHCVDDVRKAMTFKPAFVEKVKKKFSPIFDMKPKVIAISIRRGDFVDNPNYAQLPVKYYLGALMTHFPGYHKKFNLLIFSDDMDYCRLHFAGLKNVKFAEGDAIEQLCAMSLCDHFIISNSTFSWWGAYLGEKDHTKIIRPLKALDGPLAKKSDEKDFYPRRWIMFDHEKFKFDLKDVTFTIPVFYDHADRSQNLSLNICMLMKDFDTNIHIQEQGGLHFAGFGQWVKYESRKDLQHFHRTKMLNDMANAAHTPIVVNWDADVIVPPAQLLEAARQIREGVSEVVYPYDGRFARVPRTYFDVLERFLDVGRLAGQSFKGTHPGDTQSVGGAVMALKPAFVRAGMENENFISYGPEDVERFERFRKLEIKVSRVKGILFHMDHHIGDNSSLKHIHARQNEAEFARISKMTRSRLKREVDSWPWVNTYTADYYETIFENAIKSRDAIFRAVIRELDLDLNKTHKVIDVGCGIGEFGHNAMQQFNFDYYGIDLKIPREKLLIPKDHYAEFDLTEPFPWEEKFPFKGPFDLVICTEVLEHIPASCADNAVKILCSLGDTVIFSAAIPGQGGLQHLNEQWQSYWAEKFEANGFFPVVYDVRMKLWHNPDCDVWYKQNLVIYQKAPEGIDHQVRLFELDLVHPQMFTNIITTYKK